DPARDAGVVQRHQPMAVPALDDVSVDGAEVDLAELAEMRVGPAQHVQDRSSLVGDSAKWHDLDAIDRSVGRRIGGWQHSVIMGPPSRENAVTGPLCHEPVTTGNDVVPRDPAIGHTA